VKNVSAAGWCCHQLANTLSILTFVTAVQKQLNNKPKDTWTSKCLFLLEMVVYL
jgi:hypothetical protein